MDWLSGALTAFVLIVPVELPDKTFVATPVLSTRFRPLPVWLGVVAAFGIQCAVAVATGHLLGRLPDRPVQLAAAALFAIGAFVLFRTALGVVSAAAVLLGSWLQRHVRLSIVRYVGAGICVVLAALAVIAAVT